MEDADRLIAAATEHAYYALLNELEASHAPPFTMEFIAEHGKAVLRVLRLLEAVLRAEQSERS